MRMRRFVVLAISVMVLMFTGCNQKQDSSVSTSSLSDDDIATTTTVLATIGDDERPPQTIPGHGPDPASQGEPSAFQVTFSESGKGVAYIAESDKKFYVVHNGTKGQGYASVGAVVLSSSGRRTAYAAQVGEKWRMVVDGKEGKPYDVLLTPQFSPDGQHVVYQAKEGEIWYVVVDEKRNEGTRASYTTPEFSADSKGIAYVEAAASSSEMKLIVSNLSFDRQSVKKSIGDLLFTVSRDRSRIAAEQIAGNKHRIIDFSFADPDAVHVGPLYDLIEQLTMSDDGKSVTYCALRDRERLIVLDSKTESFPPGRLRELPVIRPDRQGVGVLLGVQDRMYLHQAFVGSRVKARRYDEVADLVYSRDSRLYAYTARKGEKWVVVVNGKEGPAFDRAVSPVFSPDGKYLVYRAREAGRRFVVVADSIGKTIRQDPPYEQVFQPVFIPDGTSIAYGVKDGQKLIWNVEGLK